MALPKIKHPLTALVLPVSKKKILVRPFLVKEEKILLMARQSLENDLAKNRETIILAIRQIVQNCVQNEDFHPEKLPLVDLEWLFLKLRAISVDNVVDVVYTDKDDQKEYPFKVNLEDITVKEPTKGTVIKVNDEITLHMRYPTSEIFSQEGSIESMVIQTLDAVQVGLDYTMAETTPKEELEAFIEDLPSSAMKEIQEFWNDLPTLKYVLKYTNSQGTEREIVMEALEDFFSFY